MKQRQELFLHLCLCIMGHKAEPYLNGGRLRASQAEGICMLNEIEGSAALGWVGAGGKVIFIHYSKYFHNLHGENRGILFSGYKPVSTQCLFLMSCLFCTCLEMGQGRVPDHFFSFSDADGWWTEWSWIASPSFSFILFSFCVCREVGWEFRLCSKVCVD